MDVRLEESREGEVGLATTFVVPGSSSFSSGIVEGYPCRTLALKDRDEVAADCSAIASRADADDARLAAARGMSLMLLLPLWPKACCGEY